MSSVRSDLSYLGAGAEGLEAYLLSQMQFWPIGINPPPGELPYPPLSIESLLLVHRRLIARKQDIPPEEQVQLNQTLEQIETVRSKWRAAWERKATQGYASRLGLWRSFLDDYRQEQDANFDRYAYEVRHRVMLQLLEPEIAPLPPAQRELLTGLDDLLKSLLTPGKFTWEPDLEPGFPPGLYWYLYGTLPRNTRESNGHLLLKTSNL